MSETHKPHARHRAATEEAPAKKQEPTEGPAATFERTAEEGESPLPNPLPEGEGIPTAVGEAEDWEAKANEYLEQWRRSAADFANFKRRTEQDRSEMAKLFNEGLVKSLLPVLDNFERALASVPDDVKGSCLFEGAALTEKQLRAALEREGLSPIEAVG